MTSTASNLDGWSELGPDGNWYPATELNAQDARNNVHSVTPVQMTAGGSRGSHISLDAPLDPLVAPEQTTVTITSHNVVQDLQDSATTQAVKAMVTEASKQQAEQRHQEVEEAINAANDNIVTDAITGVTDTVKDIHNTIKQDVDDEKYSFLTGEAVAVLGILGVAYIAHKLL